MTVSITRRRDVGCSATWSTYRISAISFIPRWCGEGICRLRSQHQGRAHRWRRRFGSSSKNNLDRDTRLGSRNSVRLGNSFLPAISRRNASWSCCIRWPAGKRWKGPGPKPRLKTPSLPQKEREYEGKSLSGGRRAGRPRVAHVEGASSAENRRCCPARRSGLSRDPEAHSRQGASAQRRKALRQEKYCSGRDQLSDGCARRFWNECDPAEEWRSLDLWPSGRGNRIAAACRYSLRNCAGRDFRFGRRGGGGDSADPSKGIVRARVYHGASGRRKRGCELEKAGGKRSDAGDLYAGTEVL